MAVKAVPVAAGLYHGLALTSTGAVFAWGWNIVGQLGNGSTNGSDVPVKVKLPGGTKVTGIAAGFAHSVALTSTGAVLAWGKNYNGNLGNGSTTDSDVPVKVNLPVGTKVTAVAAGGEHSLAVTSTGAVLAWGYNADGQLGDGGTGASAVPVSVSLPTGTKVTAVAAGALHSLALTSTGAVLAWGYNADGELGDGGRTNSDVPVKVKPAPRHEGDRGRRRRLLQPGADLDWRGARLGLQRRRRARRRQHDKQRCAGEGEAARGHEGDRRRRRRLPRRSGRCSPPAPVIAWR